MKYKKYDKNYFDEIYFTDNIKSHYSKEWTWKDKKETALKSAKVFIKEFKLDGKRVLDLGCGLGFLVRALRELGVEAYGIDVSEYAVKQGENLTQVDITEEKIPFNDEYFDLVICQDVLEHLPFDKHGFVFNEISRVCKGFLFIHSPSLFLPEQIYGNEEDKIDISHISTMPPYYYVSKFKDFDIQLITNPITTMIILLFTKKQK